MKSSLFIILLLFLFHQSKLEKSSRPATQPTGSSISAQNQEELLERFTDSLHVGKPSRNKIELLHFRNPDSNYVLIRFYTKTKNNLWHLKQKFHFLKDDDSGCFTELSDFNNDGFKDLTYKSALAARGANDIRNLFIYDPGKDQLVYMKNSENYPNMLYNKKLNCIDAFLVHGGSTTVFLKIKRDSLKEFASVNLDDKINVQVIDKNGNKKYLIRNRKNTFEVYTRFKNFSPLIPY